MFVLFLPGPCDWSAPAQDFFLVAFQCLCIRPHCCLDLVNVDQWGCLLRHPVNELPLLARRNVDPPFGAYSVSKLIKLSARRNVRPPFGACRSVIPSTGPSDPSTGACDAVPIGQFTSRRFGSDPGYQLLVSPELNSKTVASLAFRLTSISGCQS